MTTTKHFYSEFGASSSFSAVMTDRPGDILHWSGSGVDGNSYQVIELMLQADNINTLQGVKLRIALHCRGRGLHCHKQ